MNVSELKKDNPSSLIFELFREEHGGAATSGELEQEIRKVDYFEPAISVSRLVGSAYTKGQRIRSGVPTNVQGTPVPWNLEKAWSPTALDSFFGCPRQFMLKYILGIPEPEDYDPFEIISAMDTGTLAHSLMEALGGEALDAAAFREKSEEYFDRFLKEHPPLIAENVPAVREQFLEMMETAYEMDPHREVALEEEDIYCTHESGVKIHGFPDRVEKLDDGTYLVVDFKSGRSVRHMQDDIGTCLQVIVYAYLMEQKGFHISGGEYRYIRLGETVTCRFDDDMKGQLSERLMLFKNCMLSGSFPAAEAYADGEDPCRYCKYKSICGKLSDSADTEEGGT
jgi:ATP-dependent helicase/DNAse subunit B